MRKIDRFSDQYSPAIVEWPCDSFDPFLNVNRPEDFQQAEEIFFVETFGWRVILSLS